MKFFNPWKMLFRPARNPLRRAQPGGMSLILPAAEVLEHRVLLTAVVPNVTLAIQGSNVTLTSTDINNPNVILTRSGGSIVVAGLNGTQITFGTSVGAQQTVAVASVNNLTINLGTGIDAFTVAGLSATGNVTINGQSTGVANVSLSTGLANIVIGGSVQANFGGEAATFNLFGSPNGGGNVTVNGAVNITEGGSGTKQVNFAGPPAGNPNGGKLILNGGVGIVDTGNGLSGLRIDDGVTITGNVSYDNSANTVSRDTVQLFSNSVAFGATTIKGALTLALSNAPYQGNNVAISGFGSPLVVTGATSLTSGDGADLIRLSNDLFKSTVTINSGSNPAFVPDQVIVQGSTFDGAFAVTMSGAFAQLGVGTDPAFAPTVFNSTFAALLSGASTSLFLSNSASTVNQVVFMSTASFTGGTPVGTLFLQGKFFFFRGALSRTNLNLG
jgi:hypothetical protein